MKMIQFQLEMNASMEKIWNVLWTDETYRKWTSPFCEGSYAETDWKEGSKVLFLSPGGSGMYSRIAKKTPHSFMSFEHLGIVKDGKELPPDADSKNWLGALENYTLKETAGKTTLIVDLNITPEHEEYFLNSFPLALQKVKELAEEDRFPE